MTGLTLETARRLEQALREQQAPVAGMLRPGLSPAQIRELTEPLGVRLPDELALWWSWHDGADGGHPARASIGGRWSWLTLGEAIEQTRFQRELAIDWALDDADPEDWFPRGAIAVSTSNGSVMACDCSGPPNEPAPTRCRMRDEPYTRSPDGADSFGTVVAWWADALESRATVWDAGEDRWIDGPGAVPLERRSTNLVS